MSSSTTFALTSVDGGTNSQTAGDAGREAVSNSDLNDYPWAQAGFIHQNLDIQYTVGVATGVPVTFVSVGDNYQDGDDNGFLDIINALLGESAPPQVLTTSYGLATESHLSKSLSVCAHIHIFNRQQNLIQLIRTSALCNSYMQLTSRGVSILFATGDGGVASTPGVQCNVTFSPTFPTCP
jgi:tripeptidyl-peptidase-1